MWPENDSPDDIEDEDLALEGIFKEQELTRGEAHGVPAIALRDFRAVLRGGESTRRRTGNIFDVWQGQAVRDTAAQAWCVASGIQQTKKFNIKELTEEGARVCALEWANRMQYMFDAHEEVMLASIEARRATMAVYVETEAFQTLMVVGDARVREVGAAIRAMNPPCHVGAAAGSSTD